MSAIARIPTTLFLSQCADEYISDYLLHGTVPPEGTVCEQDWVPFAGMALADQILAAKEGRSLAMPEMVPGGVLRGLR